jgi:hypothetical protein
MCRVEASENQWIVDQKLWLDPERSGKGLLDGKSVALSRTRPLLFTHSVLQQR